MCSYEEDVSQYYYYDEVSSLLIQDVQQSFKAQALALDALHLLFFPKRSGTL